MNPFCSDGSGFHEDGRPRRAVAPARGLSAGFTLIEILVVIAIVGLVMAAVASCLFAGIRVWETAQTVNTVERESYVGLEMMRKDLMNSFLFHAVPFDGSADSVSFPGLVAAAARGRDARIGVIKYGIDSERAALVRRAAAYPVGDGGEAFPEPAAENVAGMSLQYLDVAGVSAGTWKDSWNDSSNHPGAVKVALTFNGINGQVKTESIFVLPECGRSQDGESSGGNAGNAGK